MLSTVWDFVWFFFWIFASVAYLIALFSVIGDLFRDRKLNGWLKALWIIFLVFLPFVTILVYLIARGGSMAERQQQSAAQMQQVADEYIRQAAGRSPAEEIAQARALLDAGSISQAEYDQLKAQALAR